jgi:hypothetical protein
MYVHADTTRFVFRTIVSRSVSSLVSTQVKAVRAAYGNKSFGEVTVDQA